MNKIVETLKNILPEEKLKEISDAVEQALAEANEELEKEYNTKLESAYEQLAAEIKEAETIAEQGYGQAYEIITDLRKRLDIQKAEFDTALEEGYEEAYQMLQEERKKNENIEQELYKQNEEKFEEIREFMIDKIDEFIKIKGKEIYENAKRDLINDPRLMEEKLILSKIVETVTDHISDDHLSAAVSAKTSEMSKVIEETKAQLKILEARNIRLSNENTKLHEQVREAAEVIKESLELDKQEKEKSKEKESKNESKATGRGQKVVISENMDKELVVKEETTEKTGTQEVTEDAKKQDGEKTEKINEYVNIAKTIR